MLHSRFALGVLCALASAVCFPAAGQSVISTHSGVVYFFEGSVFLGDQPLEQKFGRFPDIAEGGELRTEQGRAEVLLTPGVMLRISDHSRIRLISSSLANTRVELLSGSAILESSESATQTSPPVLIYKSWQLRIPKHGVARVDAEPPQVRVYKGEAEVSADGKADPVTVSDSQTLPLAEVLLTERSGFDNSDPFKTWAMARSQSVYADNTTAALISDDPGAVDGLGADLAGFSYFPMTGVPALGVLNPYGLSFWSPYQSTLTSLYLQRYGGVVPSYLGWPIGTRYPLHLGGIGTSSPYGSGGLRPVGITSPRIPGPPVYRGPTHVPVARPPAMHLGGHVGHR